MWVIYIYIYIHHRACEAGTQCVSESPLLSSSFNVILFFLLRGRHPRVPRSPGFPQACLGRLWAQIPIRKRHSQKRAEEVLQLVAPGRPRGTHQEAKETQKLTKGCFGRCFGGKSATMVPTHYLLCRTYIRRLLGRPFSAPLAAKCRLGTPCAAARGKNAPRRGPMTDKGRQREPKRRPKASQKESKR